MGSIGEFVARGCWIWLIQLPYILFWFVFGVRFVFIVSVIGSLIDSLFYLVRLRWIFGNFFLVFLSVEDLQDLLGRGSLVWLFGGACVEKGKHLVTRPVLCTIYTGAHLNRDKIESTWVYLESKGTRRTPSITRGAPAQKYWVGWVQWWWRHNFYDVTVTVVFWQNIGRAIALPAKPPPPPPLERILTFSYVALKEHNFIN